ncbi:hypothetical protein BKA93DRAFT_584512 [Sparassis latifolia]
MTDSGSYPSCLYAKKLLPMGILCGSLPVNRRVGDSVLIGNVGIIEGGHFFRVFNAVLDSHHTVNENRVSEHYVPFRLDKTKAVRDGFYKGPLPVCSSEVTFTYTTVGENDCKGVYHFNCPIYKEGAVLVIGDTTREVQLPSDELCHYILQNYASWIKFIENKEHDVTAKETVFVRGHID